MKLLIAVDMEGISGVVNWDQVDPSHAEYQRFRAIMTEDVNAAIQGAAAAGTAEFLVADGHWNSSNILIEKLDPRAHLNSGTPSPFSMVQGVDSGVDAAFFIGYHACAGSLHAILDHTWSSARVANVWLNGRLTGEFGLNASVCGHFGVPALMVSGDQTVCAEAREWVAGVETAQVKKAASRWAAECLPLEASRQVIRETAERAVRSFMAGKYPPPLKIKTPVTVRVEFLAAQMADSSVIMPGAVRVDGRTVEFTAPDMPAAYLAFRSAVGLALR
ncbi:MAG TPA: hypothetical protein DCP32_06020 [Anaerolineaceae bacterium]|nr:MAG: hypothetical protein A2X24_04390 [Chloroflexi bacterium GWB2_54_36]HAL16306.1 hypothetical protein [Anaerolineaceae bacterium]HBA92640.1 hypothetical protein [Anaerolineaceae bacterium]